MDKLPDIGNAQTEFPRRRLERLGLRHVRRGVACQNQDFVPADKLQILRQRVMQHRVARNHMKQAGPAGFLAQIAPR